MGRCPNCGSTVIHVTMTSDAATPWVDRLRSCLGNENARVPQLTYDEACAVLNLIEAAREVVEMDEHAGKRRHPTKLEVALAPFMDESW